MLRLGLGLTALVLTAPAAHAAKTVWTVGGTDFDYATIQGAIDAADPGDTVVVVDGGTYSECLSITKELTVVASRGADAVRVSCSRTDLATVEITSADVRLGGFVISHSSGTGISVDKGRLVGQHLKLDGLSSTASGGAIAAIDSEVVLGSVEITDSSAADGGGAIYLRLGKLTARDVAISGSSAVDGGGVYLDGAALDAVDLRMVGNSAESSGGAIFKTGTGALNLRDSVIDGNSADTGGGLHLEGSVAHSIRGSVIKGNTATTGAGIDTASGLTLLDAEVSGNTATEDGGGIVHSGTLVVQGGSVERNDAGGSGGGIYSSGNAVIRDTFVADNTAGVHGGGLYHRAGTIYLYGGSFELNEARDSGGGLYEAVGALLAYGTRFDANIADVDGGGIALADGLSSTANLYGVVLDGNDAGSNGGGLYVGRGGRIYNYGLTAVDNTATTGGGVYVGHEPANLHFYESDIDSNRATQGGGIAHVAPSLNTTTTYYWYLSRSHVHGNTATKDGGGIYVDKGSFYPRDAWIYENEAGTRGGGIYAHQNTYLFSRGTTYCANSATDGGGIFVDQGWGLRQFYVTPIVENTASRAGGAAFTNGFQPTSGYQNYSYFYYSTVVGNTASGTLFDGLHLDNSVSNLAYQYNYYNVLQGNGDSGMSQALSSPTYQVPYAGVFWAHTKAHLYNSSYTIGTNELYAINPNFPSWRSGNCFDDDLTDRSGKNWGASATTGIFGYYLYVDSDGDGYTIAEGDCEEGRAGRSPGGKEIAHNGVDEDCSGWDLYDGDGDGAVGTSSGGSDCNDGNAAIYVGATDAWYDGVDRDCSGGSDYDQDGDGFDSATYGGEDCDDLDPATHPGAVEVPFDDIDQDCDGLDQDFDGDGFTGSWTDSLGNVLSNPPSSEGDCDATDGEIFPGQVEIWYDGVDSDCLGDDDYDQDHDGWRSDLHGGLDCDDLDPEVSPDTPEVWYDGIDNNCLGDDDFDQDGDGDRSDDWGGDDCNDTDPAIYGTAPDILDGIDNNCDGIDDNDSDGDGVLDWYEEQAGTRVDRDDTEPDTIEDGIEWGDIDTHDGQLNPLDSDGDTIIDAKDTDSDDDGLDDKDEVGPNPRVPRDSDGDGLADYRDPDDDGDGLATSIEIADGIVDSDDDGTPNHLDVDSDGDGALDGAEGTGDKDGDGVPDYLDPGGDAGATREPIEPDSYGFGLGCSTSSATPIGLAWLLLLPLLGVRRRR